MSANEPLEPLGGLAARALAAEREHLPHDAARADKLFSRVLLSVGASAVGVAAAGTAHAAAGAAAGGAPLAAGAGAATKLPLGVVTAKTAAGLAALAFAVGAGTGAAVERSRRPEPIAPQPTVSASPSPSAPPALTLAPSAPEPLPSATTAPLNLETFAFNYSPVPDHFFDTYTITFTNEQIQELIYVIADIHDPVSNTDKTGKLYQDSHHVTPLIQFNFDLKEITPNESVKLKNLRFDRHGITELHDTAVNLINTYQAGW